jgi:hypothetical protein
VRSTEITVLTDAKIKALRRPTSGQAEIRDKTVPGLRVRIGAAGTKTFVLRKTVAGRYRNVTLNSSALPRRGGRLARSFPISR